MLWAPPPPLQAQSSPAHREQLSACSVPPPPRQVPKEPGYIRIKIRHLQNGRRGYPTQRVLKERLCFLAST